MAKKQASFCNECGARTPKSKLNEDGHCEFCKESVKTRQIVSKLVGRASESIRKDRHSEEE